MLRDVISLARRLVDKTELVLRARLRAIEVRRHDRLYGALPNLELPRPLDAGAQAAKLADIVMLHCQSSHQITQAQASAELKLDAAEYAFSTLLEELRGVMVSSPSEWAPNRSQMLPQNFGDAAVAQARAA